MPLTIEILQSISSISPDEYNKIYTTNIEGYNLLRAVEESHLQGIKIFYIRAIKENQTIAILPFYIMDFPIDSGVQGPIKHLTEKLIKFAPYLLRPKVIFCGCPVFDYTDLGICPGSLGHILKTILDKLDNICAAEKVGILIFKDIPKIKYPDIADVFLKNGFFEIPTFPSAQLNINFKGFEEYLATLGSSTRKDMRRKLRKAAINTIELEVYNDISQISDQIYQLYTNTQNRADVNFENLPKDFFINISKFMPGIARFFIYKAKGKIVAFNLLFIKDNICIDKYIGFDYSIIEKNNLYFTTWALNLDWCIKNGITLYQVGQTDYDPKIRLGCTLTGLYMYIRHRNTLLNCILKVLGSFLNPVKCDPVLSRIAKGKRNEKIFISN